MDSGLFLGDQFFAWMMLAFGAALVVGNVTAMVKRPAQLEPDSIAKPPKRRTITMASIGLVIAIWALASILVNA